MANAEHLEKVLQGPDQWNIYIESQTTDFRADLGGADLRYVNLTRADLRGANLIKAKLNGANLREADLREADLRMAHLFGADLRKADLTEANLFGAWLRGADFSGANLSGSDLSSTVYVEAYLSDANLTGANLRGTELRRANLRGANLFRVNLVGADLKGGDLTDADLTGADLRDANLTDANLTRTNLTGTNLKRANLDGTDVTNSGWNSLTEWPLGFTPEDSGSLPAISELPGSESNRRYRVTIDVGPSAPFEELSQILADMGLLSQVAASWATLEKELTENDKPSGNILVKAPRKTGLGGEVPSIVSVTYRNPLDIEIAGVAVGAIIALVMVIPNCRKAWAEGTKAKVETEVLRRQLETQPSVTAQFKATPAQIVAIFQTIAGSLQAARRLSPYEIEVSEAERDPDEDPE